MSELRAKLVEEIDNWQEDELKSFFIIPVMEAIDFRLLGCYKIFTQRIMEADVPAKEGQTISLKGRVELVVASGTQDPEAPFFLVHEYKPQTGAHNDPLGQLLAAMLVAQEKNASQTPVFGLYVIGRLWFFVVLEDKEYAVSKGFDATEDALDQIGAILKARKLAIDAHFLGGE